MKKHLLIIVSALVSVLSLNLIAVTATEPTVKNIYYDDGIKQVTLPSTWNTICKRFFGFAAVSKGGTWYDEEGYVDGKWGFIDSMCDFSEGLAAVVKDTTGKVVIPLTYDCSMYEEFYFNCY